MVSGSLLNDLFRSFGVTSRPDSWTLCDVHLVKCKARVSGEVMACLVSPATCKSSACPPSLVDEFPGDFEAVGFPFIVRSYSIIL